jgi:hypothetical protein
MATAKRKLVPVKDWNTGKTIKVECAACYDEESSYACVRPAHDAYKGSAEPITKEVLAASIVQIGDTVKKLYDIGLNRRAVVALIADDTKLGKGTIEAVLDSLISFRNTYTK